MKIKLKDKVKVQAGKNAGQVSVVTKVLKKQGKVVVEKVNMVTKHIKKTAQQPGQKIQFEKPIDVSNVQLVCPRCGKVTRVGYRLLENGKKERICKKCAQPVDQPTGAKK